MAQHQIVARGRSMIDDDSSDRVSQQSEEELPSEGECPAVHPPVHRTIERLDYLVSVTAFRRRQNPTMKT